MFWPPLPYSRLTNFRPADHPWHYALWFSWKYINRPKDAGHVNYGEERQLGEKLGTGSRVTTYLAVRRFPERRPHRRRERGNA